jgi:hypothetical protein
LLTFELIIKAKVIIKIKFATKKKYKLLFEMDCRFDIAANKRQS